MVMSFAGHIMSLVMDLAENGRPTEKRACQYIMKTAMTKMNQEHFQNEMKKVLGEMF